MKNLSIYLDTVFFSRSTQNVNLINLFADDKLGGHSDKVVAQGLRHKWERPGEYFELSHRHLRF